MISALRRTVFAKSIEVSSFGIDDPDRKQEHRSYAIQRLVHARTTHKYYLYVCFRTRICTQK